MANLGRQVNVYGVGDIFLSLNAQSGAASSPTWAELGTTRDGVGLTSDGYFLDIHNDENGGESGPPIEIQFLGETAKIRIELTKYDPVVAALLEDHCQNTTNGTPAAAGTLMFAASQSSGAGPGFQNGGCVALVVSCLTPTQTQATTTPFATGSYTRRFNRIVIHDAFEVNRGTKFSTLVVTGTAYKDVNGRVWIDAQN